MDILDTAEQIEISEEKVLNIKEEATDVVAVRGRARAGRGGRRGPRAQHTTVATIEPASQEQIAYELEPESGGPGMAVTYRVVQLSEDLVSYGNNSPPQVSSPATVYTNSINGGLCVFGGSPIEVYPLTPPKTVLPRVRDDSPKSVVTKDDKRRATHNEVERRRRDKINHWIMKLSKIIPDCKQDTSKGGFESQSKGCILAKACEYISELKDVNKRLLISIKQHEQLMVEMETMTRKLEEVTQENDLLKEALIQHGVPLP